MPINWCSHNVISSKCSACQSEEIQRSWGPYSIVTSLHSSISNFWPFERGHTNPLNHAYVAVELMNCHSRNFRAYGTLKHQFRLLFWSILNCYWSLPDLIPGNTECWCTFKSHQLTIANLQHNRTQKTETISTGLRIANCSYQYVEHTTKTTQQPHEPKGTG